MTLYQVFLLDWDKASRDDRYDVQYKNKKPQPEWYTAGPCPVEAEDEHELFEILNIRHPKCWRAPSLSVGDIVIDENGDGLIVRGVGWDPVDPILVDALLKKRVAGRVGESRRRKIRANDTYVSDEIFGYIDNVESLYDEKMTIFKDAFEEEWSTRELSSELHDLATRVADDLKLDYTRWNIDDAVKDMLEEFAGMHK